MWESSVLFCVCGWVCNHGCVCGPFLGGNAQEQKQNLKNEMRRRKQKSGGDRIKHEKRKEEK